jgi:hypothetical protein
MLAPVTSATLPFSPRSILSLTEEQKFGTDARRSTVCARELAQSLPIRQFSPQRLKAEKNRRLMATVFDRCVERVGGGELTLRPGPLVGPGPIKPASVRNVDDFT